MRLILGWTIRKSDSVKVFLDLVARRALGVRADGQKMLLAIKSMGGEGDAALAFDPLAAQGLFNALYTGFAAARAIAAELSGEAESDRRVCRRDRGRPRRLPARIAP